MNHPNRNYIFILCDRKVEESYLYSSPAEAWITFSDVAGKCFVTYQENLIDKTNDDLMKELPHQFYFAEAYDTSRRAFVEPPIKAQSMGRLGKVSLFCEVVKVVVGLML